MRAYGSKSFGEKKRSGKSWRWLIYGLIFGFVGGFAAATAINVREPIQLVITAPSDLPADLTEQEVAPETAEEEAVYEIWSDSKNISVQNLQPNTLVRSPLIVEGLERTFEQNVVLRLKDAGGRELAKTFTTGNAPDMGIHGPYRAELTFDRPRTRAGTLEVFQNSPKDGSEIDKVTVSVRFE